MRAGTFAALAAALPVAQAWSASKCLSECAPTAGTPYPLGTAVGARFTCPLASMAETTAAYVVSVKAASGASCPGSCTPVTTEAACENAAAWLQLGADGDMQEACPSAEQLVGASGLWDAVSTADQSALSGCSWSPRASQKLVFNTANTAVGTDIVDHWLICRCAAHTDLPKYAAVVAGSSCPDAARQKALGVAPSCSILTAEGNCWEAASAQHLDLPDKSLEMCTSDCDTATPVLDTSINTPEWGPHRPAGCHYRYHPDIADDHLWFNPHYNASAMAEAQPTGEGVMPDYLICGCGDVASVPQPQGCRPMGTRSMACGVGQYCAPTATGYTCTCEFPLSTPDTGVNKPAECREEIPTKFVSWVSGTQCPFDEHTQCMTPPSRERCEKAAQMLGLADTTASLPHSAADSTAPAGCHYLHGDESALRYNNNATGNVAASPSDSLICECVHYPLFVPVLAKAGCGAEAGACRPADTRFECGLAADYIGLPVPEEVGLATWNATLCVEDPNAGPGPYVPCGSPNAPDCTLNGANTRRCRYTDGGQQLVLLDSPGGAATTLDGCVHHATSDATGSPLWFYAPGNPAAVNSAADFRICDCADEGEHQVIAPRLGFDYVGDGDCSKGAAPGNSCDGQAADLCVVSGGEALLRSDRFDCAGMPTEAACLADVEVCKWENGACSWKEATFAAEGEVPALFSDCLEHCLLLCHCTGVSFFVKEGNTPDMIGGCDFFAGEIVRATGEAVRAGKGAGNWTCYRNTPEASPTPAPVWDCPQCNVIPGQYECRNTHGCAWSGAGYCCCDPFVSSCTHSWHTATNSQETCEAATDDGRECEWLQGKNGGICELPLEKCVDIYVDIVFEATLAAFLGQTTEAAACVQYFNEVNQVAQGLGIVLAAGCGDSCNVTEEEGRAKLVLAVDVQGDVSCGQATRDAARIKANAQIANTISVGVESACWLDCARNPLCPKGPTAAPTPIGGPSPTGSPARTLPPVRTTTEAPQQVAQDVPTSGPTQSPVSASDAPTASPDLCPVLLEIDSPGEFACECERWSCADSVPFNNSGYGVCDRTCDDRLNNAHHFKCPVCAPAQTQMNITCPNHYEACDIFLVVYQKPGCSATSTDSVNGGWIQTLPADGFKSTSCAPQWCGPSTCQDESTDYRHVTVGLHKQVLGGETEELPATTTDPSMYFTILVQQSRVCAGIQDANECNAGPGLCAWENGQCKIQFCPPTKETTPVSAAPRVPPEFEGPPRPDNVQPPVVPPCCMIGTPSGDCALAEAV